MNDKKGCYRDDDCLVRHMRQFEVPLGSYVFESQDGTKHTVPNHSLVVYVDLNTKSELNAFHDIHQSLEQAAFAKLDPQIFHGVNDRALRAHEQGSLASTLVSWMQKAKAVKNTPRYVDLDIDTKDPLILSAFVSNTMQYLMDAIICIIETFGGYHMVLSAATLGVHRRKLDQFLSRADLEYMDTNRVGGKK
jgi:hypothetical protein